jgi:hypothetical protein
MIALCVNAGCEYHSYAPAVGGKCVMKPVEHDWCADKYHNDEEACRKADCEYHSYAPAVGGICAMWPKVVEPEHEMCK